MLTLYPKYLKETTVSCVKEWKKQIEKRDNSRKIEWSLIEHYYDFPPYIEAFVERINQSLEKFAPEKRSDVHLLFSAHGTPMKLVREGDPYSEHIRKTVELVMQQGAFKQKHSLAWQSKVGPQKWLTPSTPDMIEEQAKKGEKLILAIPIAFASDHLETLFEVGIEFKHLAMKAGVEQFEVTEGLNYSEKFIDALAQLVLSRRV